MGGIDQGKDGLQSNLTLRWYVVFEDLGDNNKWWHMFTRPGMRHVWAFARNPEPLHGWTRVDYGRGFCRVDHVTDDELKRRGFDHLAKWCEANNKIVLPCISRITGTDSVSYMPMNCVAVVKSLLNLHRCRAVTPWQLYKYLVKHRLDVVEYSRILSKSDRASHGKSS